MTESALASSYRSAWQTFVQQTGDAYGSFRRAASVADSTNLHALLREVYDIPYHECHRLICWGDPQSKAKNIGSVTGLFFEQVVAAMITGYLCDRLPGTRLERNTCANSDVSEVARDPDIVVSANGRHVVFEAKVSPKRRDLAWVRRLRGKYGERGIKYLLIGGYASLAPSDLQALAAERWACIITGSNKNKDDIERLPRFDDLLAEAASYLGLPNEG